jgi:hypothetical protein
MTMEELSGLLHTFSDATIYLIMAVIGTVFFLARLGMVAIFGIDGDTGDGMDADMDAGEAHADSSAVFSLFSLLSILAFFMGAGWMGLAARLEMGLGTVVSALVAGGFGFFMMVLAAGLMFGMRKLNREVTWDARSSIGSGARVYLTIPEKGKGRGQVEVSVSGRRKVLPAISTKEKIESFMAVTVVDVEDDGSLVVEPRG